MYPHLCIYSEPISFLYSVSPQVDQPAYASSSLPSLSSHFRAAFQYLYIAFAQLGVFSRNVHKAYFLYDRASHSPNTRREEAPDPGRNSARSHGRVLTKIWRDWEEGSRRSVVPQPRLRASGTSLRVPGLSVLWSFRRSFLHPTRMMGSPS